MITFSRINGLKLAPSIKSRFQEQFHSHRCFYGILPIFSVVRISSGTMAIPNASAPSPSNRPVVKFTGHCQEQFDWEDAKKGLPPGTPKQDDSAPAARALLFAPTSVHLMVHRLGGVGYTEQTGGILKVQRALSGEEKIIQSFRSRGMTRWPMPNVRVNSYLWRQRASTRSIETDLLWQNRGFLTETPPVHNTPRN